MNAGVKLMKRSHRVVVFALSVGSLLSACNERSSAESKKGGAPAPDSTGSAQDSAIPWNTAVGYDSLVDSRDSHVYRTVVIGKQVWMAENLDFRPSGADSGWCYQDDPGHCARYGRLYTWAMAMGRSLHSRIPGRAQGICPDGWFVPSAAEWDSLAAFVERDPRVGAGKGGDALKATGVGEFSGSDPFGFRGLPSGYRYGDRDYRTNGHEGFWLTSTEPKDKEPSFRGLSHDLRHLVAGDAPPAAAYAGSLRCVK